MSLLPDPATLRVIAARISAAAEVTRSRAVTLAAALHHDQWRGAAALAFGAFVEPVISALHASATDLDRAAAALRQLAMHLDTIYRDLAAFGVDLDRSSQDLIALLRDGADPETLLHPRTLIQDGVRLARDGAHLARDGLHLLGDAADDIGDGVATGAQALGSLVGL